MNRKILVSGISIFSALAIMGGAAFALFSNSASAINNTFATGNADLQIAQDLSGTPDTFGDSITGPTFTGMFPGQSRTFDFWLRNNSSSAITLDLTADVNAINPSGDGDQAIDNALLISWTCDTTGNGSLGDETPTSEFSPRDWFNGGNASLSTLAPSTNMFCRMTGRLPSSADSTVADQTVIFDALYDGTQTP